MMEIRTATADDVPGIVGMLADDPLGASIVTLTSDASRTDAHRFYERLGFFRSHHGFRMIL